MVQQRLNCLRRICIFLISLLPHKISVPITITVVCMDATLEL